MNSIIAKQGIIDIFVKNIVTLDNNDFESKAGCQN